MPRCTHLVYQGSIAQRVCGANLNHIGWAHLWKQMSTGAGMLFLFRLENQGMEFFSSSTSFPVMQMIFQVPSTASPPTSYTQKGSQVENRKHQPLCSCASQEIQYVDISYSAKSILKGIWSCMIFNQFLHLLWDNAINTRCWPFLNEPLQFANRSHNSEKAHADFST